MQDQSKIFAVSSIAGAGLLFAPGVFAHTFGAHGAGFADGLAHPFLGLDHLLAMLAVGLWAVQLGGAALWRVPGAFVSAMACGALLANSFMDAAWLETAIDGSVLALGLLVAFALPLPGGAGLLAAGLFALFHGAAHGLEMPQAASPSGYGAGFLLATASLHLLGVLLGVSLRRTQFVLRAGGAAIAAAGLILLTA